MKVVGVVFGILLFFNCSSSKKSVEPTIRSRAVDKMVQQKKFEVLSDWASPLATSSFTSVANSGLLLPGNTAGNISLIGNGNYLKMKKDSVFGYLPYYGERRQSGAYGANDTGISFEGIPEQLSITHDTIKLRYQIYFEIADKNNPTENYQIRMTLFPNQTSMLNVNSSHRTSINYKGRVFQLRPEKEL